MITFTAFKTESCFDSTRFFLNKKDGCSKIYLIALRASLGIYHLHEDYRMSSDLDYMSQDEIDDEDLKMTLETLKSVIWVV